MVGRGEDGRISIEPRRKRLIARLASLALLAAAQPAAAADRAWQDFQMPRADEILARWRDPPAEYGPEPYYSLAGPVTLASIRRDLDRMKALGFRAVTVQYGQGLPFAYLSPEHLAFFARFVAEAKARDMRLWIVDDAGYPSGFAGGKFSAEHPELRMQVLLPAARWPVAAGELLDRPAPLDLVAATATEAGGRTIAIPVADGRLRWRAPAGSWTVTAVVHAFKTSPTRSDTNPTRAKDESQSLEDYLDPAATAHYLAFTHEAYKRAVGAEFGRTILGFRGDEPDYSTPGLPWTPRLFARFEALKHYDVRPFLAAFLPASNAPLTGVAAQARADYYDVFSRMFADGFFAPQAAWCAANGLEYQVHLNHEERQIELARSEGDFFRDFAMVQVPGIDAIWHQIWTDTIADFPRLASSAAHVYGHPRAFTESFAAYRPAPDLAMARYIIDEQFVRGINLVEMMAWPSAAIVPERPLPLYMRDPGFPALARYTQRMSYLLSMGRPAAAVALLQPRQALWNGDVRGDAMVVAAERLLSEHQIDFDIVDEDAVARLIAADGTFATRSGNRFRTVIVPRTESLPAAVLARLEAFAKAGGKVLFLGGRPGRTTGSSYRDVRFVGPGALDWAEVAPGELAPVPTPPGQPPKAPPPPQAVPPQMMAAIERAVGADALRLATPDPALRYTHRRIGDATVFLLFNEGARGWSGRISLARGATGRLERWDPQTGLAVPLEAAPADGARAETTLSLEPYATAVIVAR